jgi:hypothetical protein
MYSVLHLYIYSTLLHNIYFNLIHLFQLYNITMLFKFIFNQKNGRLKLVVLIVNFGVDMISMFLILDAMMQI